MGGRLSSPISNNGDGGNLASALILAKKLYEENKNVVEGVFHHLAPSLGESHARRLAIQLAYDLQAGSYTALAQTETHRNYAKGLAEQVRSVLSNWKITPRRFLDLGIGEGTTTGQIVAALGLTSVFGADISYSRLTFAKRNLEAKGIHPLLFVAEIAELPILSGSFDLVATVHALEPNGGEELVLLSEIARVSSRWVLLVEPDWVNANEKQRDRMESHGYVKLVSDYFDYAGLTPIHSEAVRININPDNPSRIHLLEKHRPSQIKGETFFACPLSKAPLEWSSEKTHLQSASGLVYPAIGGLPFLSPQNWLLARQPAV